MSSSLILLAMMQVGQPAFAESDGVGYRIAWDTSDNRYHVFLQPTTTPSPDVSYTGAQVTLKVPHALGTDKFSVVETDTATQDGILSHSGTEWYIGMEAIAKESNGSCSIDPRTCQTDVSDSDYITFVMSINKLNAFAFQANQEVEAFSFAVEGACNAQVQVMPNDDPFNQPDNSIGTNPGNFFINSGWSLNSSDPLWTSRENHYLGTYGAPVSCIDPSPVDTDSDGLTDAEEAVLHTDPSTADTDGDGKNDKDEVGSNINTPTDTDNDGKIDALESSINDADNDGVPDELDAEDNNPENDSDGDGYGNLTEKNAGTNPLDPNSKPVTPPADTDSDGLTDTEESTLKTDPAKQDTDGDGKNDKVEVGADISTPTDTDKDGKIDALESSINDADNDGVPDELDAEDNNPENDSDGDGYGNLTEKNAGTNPLDPNSKPTPPAPNQVAVPTLGEWAQILMSILLLASGLWHFRRNKQ